MQLLCDGWPIMVAVTTVADAAFLQICYGRGRYRSPQHQTARCVSGLTASAADFVPSLGPLSAPKIATKHDPGSASPTAPRRGTLPMAASRRRALLRCRQVPKSPSPDGAPAASQRSTCLPPLEHPPPATPISPVLVAVPASATMSGGEPVRHAGRPHVGNAPAVAAHARADPPAHADPAALGAAVVTDEQLLAMKPLKPRKRATFEAATPSNYCHICSRTPNRGIRLAVCASLREGLCRKVVCERCFSEYALGCSFEDAANKAVDWKCVHCQGICPERAQCRTYQNVNRKLRLQRLRQSVGPVESAAGTAAATAAVAAAGTAPSVPTPAPRKRPHEHRKNKQLKVDSVQGPAPTCAQQTSACPASQPPQVYSSMQQPPVCYDRTPAHVHATSNPPYGYTAAKTPVYSLGKSDLGPSYTASNAYTNGYSAAAVYDKSPNILSPKSIAAREPYVLESSEGRQPLVERSYIRHTALSTTNQDRGPLHRQIASVPQRTYRVCSTIAKPGPLVGATRTPTAASEKLCHLCGASESAATETFTNCSGAMSPECSKAFCERCMEKKDLRLSKVASEARGERWNCSHCTDMCPTESACYRGGAFAVISGARKVSADTGRARQGDGMSLKRRLLAAATASE